ncbi:ECM15 [Candida pseudojiufengensis]|uniref:ECM15 n=1 Tax=Candida pseudojiufengensis TaxID=497109 RepID=UPI002225398B|nr:ECM15 [Candida pseudojiufengensis]KAI5965184.1 ECM15 [Candida pseudojiufengensis]
MASSENQDKNLNCLADICLIPIGKGTPSVSDEVAIITQLCQNQTKVKTHLQSSGTVLEGDFDDVMALIKKFHLVLHDKGIVRIQSDIRLGSRIDKSQTPQDKLDIVYKKLKDLK